MFQLMLREVRYHDFKPKIRFMGDSGRKSPILDLCFGSFSFANMESYFQKVFHG